MNLDSFKNWAVSQGSVAKTNGGYIGECVSLINQYLSKVYGIQAGAWGNAKDWATNGTVATHFDKVSSPQAGDIGISGATATNPYGHIWIYLTPNLVLEQNGRVSRKVSVNAPLFKPIAILRRKGTGVVQMAKNTLSSARILAETILGRDRAATHAGKGDADLIANHVGKELTEQYIYGLWTSGEASAYVRDKEAKAAFYNKYVNQVAELGSRPTKAELDAVNAKLAAEAAKVAKAEAALKAEQEKKSEDTVLLDEAGSWFTKLFNRLFKKG